MRRLNENRHKEALLRMVAVYRIMPAGEAPYVYPGDVEWVSLVIGYIECINSSTARACSHLN